MKYTKSWLKKKHPKYAVKSKVKHPDFHQEPASKDDVWIFDDGNDIHPTAQEGM